MNEPDLIVTSKTQTPEQIEKVLRASGYENFKTETATDEPGVTVEPAAPSETDLSESSTEAGQQAGPKDGETGAEPEPAQSAQEQEEARRRKGEPGSAKVKRQRDEARDRAARLEAENEELKRKLAAPAAGAVAKEPEPAPAVSEKPKPKFEDFAKSEDQLADYAEALTDWKLEQRDAKQEAQRKQLEATQAGTQAKVDEWRGTGSEKYPDFTEVALSPKLKISNAMSAVVLDHERSHDLAYWLGQNPEVCQRIYDLTNLPATATEDQKRKALAAAYRQIGKIEDKLPPEEVELDDDVDETEEEPAKKPSRETRPAVPAPATPPVTAPATPAAAPAAQPPPPKKPTPITPVGGRGAAVPQKRIEQMSAEELRALPPDEYRRLAGGR